MNRDRWAFLVFVAGVGLVIGSILWSLSAYGEVGQMVASKGLRPANSFHCLMLWGGTCDLLAAAHETKGTLAYTPLTFWVGIAAVLASFWMQLQPRQPGEAWGAGCNGSSFRSTASAPMWATPSPGLFCC